LIDTGVAMVFKG